MDDLDIDELERRIELASAFTIADLYGGGCAGLCGVLCGTYCQSEGIVE